jgi:hypothetical protein
MPEWVLIVIVCLGSNFDGSIQRNFMKVEFFDDRISCDAELLRLEVDENVYQGKDGKVQKACIKTEKFISER